MLTFQVVLVVMIGVAALGVVHFRWRQRALTLLLVALFALMGFAMGKWSDVYYRFTIGGWWRTTSEELRAMCSHEEMRSSDGCGCLSNSPGTSSADENDCGYQIHEDYRHVLVERQWRHELLPWMMPAVCSGAFDNAVCQSFVRPQFPATSLFWLPPVATGVFTLVGCIIASVVYLWGQPHPRERYFKS
jgi:hypothetical protein